MAFLDPTSKRAVVTGGGTGLGLASGLALRAQGFEIIALGLDTEPELEGSGIEFRPLDVTDTDAVLKFAADCPDIDVLVNAAGTILHEGREHTHEGFRKVIDVNLIGTEMFCQSLRSKLAERRGNIVNFASMWSFFGSGLNPGYASSKGAIVALTRSLAVAFAPEGIRVNAVAPGWIETRLAVAALTDPIRGGAIKQRIPLGSFGKPVEVGKAVRFLSSDEASYITGVVLPVDGGYSVA